MTRSQCPHCGSTFHQSVKVCPVCGGRMDWVDLEGRLLPVAAALSLAIAVVALGLIFFALSRGPAPAQTWGQHLGAFAAVLVLCGLPPLILSGLLFHLWRKRR